MNGWAKLAKLTRVEATLLLREPATWIVAAVLPTAILLLVGVIFGHGPSPELGGQRFIDLFVPSMVVITVATLGVQALPVRLATYREKGVLRRMSTAPVHPGALLAAQLVINVVLAIVALVLLIVVGNVAFGIPVPQHLVGFAAAFVLGLSSLLALGLLVAAVAPSARSATALSLPVFFAAMFLGGVYLPRWLLPEFLVRLGDYTPPGVQAMLDAWSGIAPQLSQLGIMAVITVVAGGAAIRLFRWE